MNKDFGNEPDTLKTRQNSYLHEGDVRRSSNPGQPYASNRIFGGGRGAYSNIDGDVPGSMRTEGADTGKSEPPLSKSLTVITWNACGMEAGVIEDMTEQLDGERWDAIMLQEGPKVEEDTYKILRNGHAFFAGGCSTSKRSVGIVVHRRWVHRQAKLKFRAVCPRILYIDFDLHDIHLRLVSAHLPHLEYTADEYEACLLAVEDIVITARREKRQTIVGMDANAVIGERWGADSERIIGDFGLGQRNARGHILVPWMHGINLAAVNTMVRNPPDSLWTHALWSTGATRQLDYVFTDEVNADDVKDSGII